MARIRLATVPSDTSPPAGQISIYAKNDNNLYLRTSLDNEYLILNSSNAPLGYQVEQITISEEQELAKEIVLTSAPTQPLRTLFFIDGAAPTFYGLDFIVIENTLSWSSTRLDGILKEGDLVRLVYF